MVVAGVYPQTNSLSPGGDREFLEPLGLEYVLAQAAQRGHEVVLETLHSQAEDELVVKVIDSKADVVAISAMTCQVHSALRIASAIKGSLPKVKVIAGGYHPSAVHETPWLISGPVDYWVAGEGEETFLQILECLESGRDPNKERVSGLVVMEEGKAVRIPRSRCQNLGVYGKPWRSMELLRTLRNHGLTYPAPSGQSGFASLDSSRGCLRNCAFCASPQAIGSVVTFRPIGLICEELGELYAQGINTFFFTDLDFIQCTAEGQARVSKLCQAIGAMNLPIYWECLGSIASVAQTANYDLLDEMYAAGCRKIGWGIETTDPELVGKMGKGHRGRADGLAEKVLAYAATAGILNTGFVVVGWSDFAAGVNDMKESIRRDMEILPSYPIHRLRVAIATPFPGSRFYVQCKQGGYMTDDSLDRYDTNHLVYVHPALTESDLLALREEMYREFYGSDLYRERVIATLQKHPEYRATFEQFLSALKLT